MPLMIKEFDGAKPELVKQEEKEVKTNDGNKTCAF